MIPNTYSQASLHLGWEIIDGMLKEDQRSCWLTCSNRSHVYTVEKISWCQNLSGLEAASATLAYGYEPSMEVYYRSAAILVGVPVWGGASEELWFRQQI